MFAKHLPPSAGLPRVLALDEAAARALPADITLVHGDRDSGGDYDAIVGHAAPNQLAALFKRLRPGGRLILADRGDPQTLITRLAAAGFIHCLAEPQAGLTLYRGERPPQGTSVERLGILNAGAASTTPFVFLLIIQTPNKPAWKVAPDETLVWRAATVLDPETGAPVLLAFSALVKAVAFMQAAILNRWLTGINKVGKFQAAAARAWTCPFVLNPDFDSMSGLTIGPLYDVDPQTAITGDE